MVDVAQLLKLIIEEKTENAQIPKWLEAAKSGQITPEELAKLAKALQSSGKTEGSKPEVVENARSLMIYLRDEIFKREDFPNFVVALVEVEGVKADALRRGSLAREGFLSLVADGCEFEAKIDATSDHVTDLTENALTIALMAAENIEQAKLEPDEALDPEEIKTAARKLTSFSMNYLCIRHCRAISLVINPNLEKTREAKLLAKLQYEPVFGLVLSEEQQRELEKRQKEKQLVKAFHDNAAFRKREGEFDRAYAKEMHNPEELWEISHSFVQDLTRLVQKHPTDTWQVLIEYVGNSRVLAFCPQSQREKMITDVLGHLGVIKEGAKEELGERLAKTRLMHDYSHDPELCRIRTKFSTTAKRGSLESMQTAYIERLQLLANGQEFPNGGVLAFIQAMEQKESEDPVIKYAPEEAASFSRFSFSRRSARLRRSPSDQSGSRKSIVLSELDDWRNSLKTEPSPVAIPTEPSPVAIPTGPSLTLPHFTSSSSSDDGSAGAPNNPEAALVSMRNDSGSGSDNSGEPEQNDLDTVRSVKTKEGKGTRRLWRPSRASTPWAPKVGGAKEGKVRAKLFTRDEEPGSSDEDVVRSLLDRSTRGRGESLLRVDGQVGRSKVGRPGV